MYQKTQRVHPAQCTFITKHLNFVSKILKYTDGNIRSEEQYPSTIASKYNGNYVFIWTLPEFQTMLSLHCKVRQKKSWAKCWQQQLMLSFYESPSKFTQEITNKKKWAQINWLWRRKAGQMIFTKWTNPFHVTKICGKVIKIWPFLLIVCAIFGR